MKVFWGIMKFFAALAVIGSIVFVVMKYFDNIMAFLRKYLNFDWLCNKAGCDADDCFEEEFCDEAFTDEAGIQAEENDFEG